MKIDEAINKCRDLAYGDIDAFEAYHVEGFRDAEYEQLAEWLEELKKYKSYKPVDKEFYKAGYAKAIQDFVKKLEEHQQENWVDNLEYGITFSDIEQVAEQLKEGGVDG